ncbi:unnamed protein product [Caenorhabditis sp. 36 PRJEB53466]|nr:unnamed protein product [Caenorhabditis sp. 36 PRJEB53466]
MNFYSFFLFAILSIALVAGNDVKRPAGHVDRHDGHAPDGDQAVNNEEIVIGDGKVIGKDAAGHLLIRGHRFTK